MSDHAEGCVPEGALITTAPGRGSVLVYTAELLPYSETFIRDHVASLKRPAVLVGGKRVRGLSTDELKTAFLPTSRSSRLALWFAGVSSVLDRLVQEHDVRLIHAHFADAGARLARYTERRGLPLVVTLHGSDVLRRAQGSKNAFFNRLLWRQLMRSADLFLPVSEHITRAAIARGFPRPKLQQHYLGIPVCSRVERTANAGEPLTILFVGRLVEKKGLTYLLDACRILQLRGHDFRVRVVGDGPLLRQWRAQAEPLADKVSFLGRLPPHEVRQELARASIFCMPSVEAEDGDNEGLPIVSLEAQAAELPVVAFNQGPVPEAISNDLTGLLARDRSSGDLADCLERLLLDPQLRADLGQRGRRNVELKFDIRRQSRQLEEIYDRVLADRSRSHPASSRSSATRS